MKIFVYEHVTGGGMAGAALPPGLVREADLMVRTLLAELSTCPGVSCVTTRDARLPPIAGVEVLEARSGESPLQRFGRGVELTEAAWPTAPETGGTLTALTAEVARRGRIQLGCRVDAVRLASSKQATADLLLDAGIPVVPTCSRVGQITPVPGRWVVKPDDGAGALDSWVVPDWMAARNRLAQSGGGLVVQPWVAGDAMSLSLLCADGSSRLLACNRQHVAVVDGAITLVGLDVNAIVGYDDRLVPLGGRIARAIPGLWGYVGVDLIMTQEGPLVLEINPRLTTSYCGLGRARGINVASMVLSLLDAKGPGPALQSPGTTVTLALEGADA